MKLNLSLKSIALVAYIALSAIFILWFLWNSFQINVMQSAYNQGMSDAVVSLIQEAGKCEPFTVYAGETQIQLQQLDCTPVAE